MMGLAQMTGMATAEGAFEFRGVQPGSYYYTWLPSVRKVRCKCLVECQLR
jgi:hypothetical protein